MMTACGGGGDGAVAVSQNRVPSSNAGPSQSALLGASITLDGSSSTDADGDALTFSWNLATKPAGSVAVLSSGTSPKPTFTADAPGNYVAVLIVNDGKVDSTSATVTIAVSAANAAPVANAGASQSVVAGSTVTLDSAASTDANGDALTSAWTLASKPSGSAAVLISGNTQRPAFVADLPGSYVASLIVNDGKVDSTASTVTVTASAANAAPVANAGPAQDVVVGSTLTLDGTASADANGDPLTFAWTLTSKPAGSIAQLLATASRNPTFTADVAGTYIATLVVNDGKINSAASTVAITATSPSVSLFQVSDSLFGGGDTLTALPFSTSSTASGSGTCVGSGCPTSYDVASFKLVAKGRSYTVTNLTATNATAGSAIQPVFSGLANGQTIAAGQTVAFKLQSPFTRNRTVDLQYRFTILETGQDFAYSVRLTTN